MKYPSAPRKSAVPQTNGNRRKTVSAPKASNDSYSVNLEEGGSDLGLKKKQMQTGRGDVEIDGTKEVGASGDNSSGGGEGGNLKVGALLGTKRMSFVFGFRREGCRG